MNLGSSMYGWAEAASGRTDAKLHGGAAGPGPVVSGQLCGQGHI